MCRYNLSPAGIVISRCPGVHLERYDNHQDGRGRSAHIKRFNLALYDVGAVV